MRLKFILFCWFFSGQIFAQNQSSPFGQITETEFLLKKYPLDTTAEAVILFDIGQISINEDNKNGYYARYTRHRRIKILNREGFKFGTVVIPYYSGSGDESVRKAKAMIHLPDGTKKTIEKDLFFREKYNKNYSALKFTFPDLQPGAIIEYTYEKYSSYIETLDAWYFQDEIPTKRSELSFFYTNRFSYIGLRTGTEPHSEQKKDRLIYTAADVPALHNEPFVTSMDDYRSNIRFQLSEFARSDGSVEKILGTWNKVAETLHGHEHFGKFLRSDDNGDVLKLAAIVIEAEKDTTEQIKKLFHFVAKTIDYNGSDRFFASDGSPDDLFHKKKGTSADINLLLIHLLNELKVVRAIPMLISSRDNGQCFKDYPFVHQFSSVLGYVVVNGEPIYLDATNPLRSFDLADKNAFNENGLVLDKKKAFWVSIKQPSDGHLCKMKARLTEDGMLKGHLDWVFYTFSALEERATGNPVAALSRWEKRLAEKFPNLTISNFEAENFDNPELPLKISFDFEVKVDQSGDVFYVQPILATDFTSNPFKQENRENPVSFATKYRMNISCDIELPVGFYLEGKPEDGMQRLPEKGGFVQFFATEDGQNLSAQFRFSLTQTKFRPDEYPVLRAFFGLWVQKTNTILVIKKR